MYVRFMHLFSDSMNAKLAIYLQNYASWRVLSKTDISRVIANEYYWMIQDMSEKGKLEVCAVVSNFISFFALMM